MRESALDVSDPSPAGENDGPIVLYVGTVPVVPQSDCIRQAVNKRLSLADTGTKRPSNV